MAPHGERERLQADPAALLDGRPAGLRAAVHQQPCLPEIQEESRSADQRPSRVADRWAASSSSNRILAARRLSCTFNHVVDGWVSRSLEYFLSLSCNGGTRRPRNCC